MERPAEGGMQPHEQTPSQQLEAASNREGEMMPHRELTVVSSGEGNDGTIGGHTDSVDPAVMRKANEDLANPEYRVTAMESWECVDGRRKKGGQRRTPEGMARNKTAGGIPITDSAVAIYTEEEEPFFSSTVAKVTSDAVVAGLEVWVHGDDHLPDGGETKADRSEADLEVTNLEGCGAAKNLRVILQRNAENAAIVVPTAAAVAGALNVGRLWQDEATLQQDIAAMVAVGAAKAADDTYWDILPAEAITLAVENGAKYVELEGSHNEGTAVVELDDATAFDAEAFATDHPAVLDDGTEIELQVFVASAAAYKKEAFKKAAALGKDEQWAARRVLGFILMNFGTVKRLTRNNFPVTLSKPAA